MACNYERCWDAAQLFGNVSRQFYSGHGVTVTSEIEVASGSVSPFCPNRRELFKFSTATAVSAGALGLSSATPAAAGKESLVSSAFAAGENATLPQYTTASYVNSLNGFGFGHILTHPISASGDRATPITIPTYDGSDVAIHPSVYYCQNAWNGYEYWMAYTPYPSAKSQLENPSIAVSHDGNTWIVPEGLTNPIEPAPPGGVNYNSDPNIVVGHDGKMYLFWRTVGVPIAGETWYFKSSFNGFSWSDRVILREDVQSVRRLVSASFSQLADGSWVAYAVDVVPRPYVPVCLRAKTLSGFATALPQPVTITGNTAQPWHMDVHRAAGEWQMLVQDGGPGGGDLWAAVSADGLHFRAGGPCIARGAGQWDSVYYKSCFVPAVKNNLFGWDTWVTGATFAAKGPIMGRTFISFATIGGSLAPPTTTDTPDPAEAITQLQLQLLAARSGIYPWIIGDSFARANSQVLGNADSGQTWVDNVGTMKLSNKAASPLAKANTRCVIETGTTDHWPSVRLDSLASATSQHWVLARFQDSNNFYRLGARLDGVLLMERHVGGVLSTVKVMYGVTLKMPGSTIGLRCVGTIFEIFVDNVKVDSLMDSALAVGTKAGIQGNDGTAVFRSFTTRIS